MNTGSCMHLDITGKLVLADSWQRKDTINDFKLSWWNTTWYPDHNLKCSLNDIDDAGVVKDTVKLESLFGFCGVKNSEINAPYYRFGLPQRIRPCVQGSAAACPLRTDADNSVGLSRL